MIERQHSSPIDLRIRDTPKIKTVARLAIWLGLIGFGGGYAVLAQLRRLVVLKWGWLSEDDYAEAVAVSQSLPGASGANFFTLLGLRAAGVTGALSPPRCSSCHRPPS